MEINFSNFDQEEMQNIKKVYNVAEKQLQLPENLCVNIVMLKPTEIQNMNKKFRGVDRVTDVLSFPMLNNLTDLEKESDAVFGQIDIGDIYICKERATEQAQEYNHSIKRELCFLALHGLLHLLGYDHIKEEDEKIMFALQDKILNEADIKRV